MIDKLEETGGELTAIPNDKYRKFFDKFAEIETLDVSQWKVAHLLGYFCKRYKEALGTDYAWKFNNPSPTKCFEVWQANTLAAKLSANPKILKDYIDWAFDTLVKGKKYKPRSISFLTKEEVVIPYKMNVLLAGQRNSNVDRSASLPTIYQDILQQTAGITISTYGDLAFISQAEPLPDNIILALDRMVEAGFDREVLKRIV
jgi:hypothetical protein